MCCSTLIRIWLMIALIQTSKQSAYNGCNYRPPDSYGDCGYSCIEQISRWQFQDLANAMPNCNSFSFYLSHGHYHSFAEKFFSLVGKVHHFFLEITNVTFSHFPNSLGSVSPFSGVIFDVSIYLQLVNIDVRNDWNWKAFEDLKPVKGGTGVFEGYGINMTHLGNGFSHVLHGHLRRIRFSGGNLKTLDDDVFTGLYCLTEVLLHDNQIQEIKRNYFPSPATVLELLVLRGNQLKSLPVDMFIDMPSLKTVDFSDNPLLTLPEAAFRPIVSRVNIVVKERFHCNCDLRWLKYAKKHEQNFNTIICESPLELEHQSVYNITNEKLGC